MPELPYPCPSVAADWVPLSCVLSLLMGVNGTATIHSVSSSHSSSMVSPPLSSMNCSIWADVSGKVGLLIIRYSRKNQNNYHNLYIAKYYCYDQSLSPYRADDHKRHRAWIVCVQLAG